MKNFAFVIAFALLAAVPASATEICQAAPAVTSEKQIQEAIPMGPQPIPRCYTVEGTSCSTTGATRTCTDACRNMLSCTCYERWGGTYGTTFLGRYWDCLDEC